MYFRFGVWGPAVGVLLLGLLFLACEDPQKNAPLPQEGPRFVATIPPVAMIVDPMVAQRGTVEVLLGPGDSPHMYEPTPSDLRKVSNGAVIVAASESLDGWVTDLGAARPLALVDLLPQEARLTFEEKSPSASSDSTVDPHFWTDPRAVMSLVPELADTLCALDASGCSVYRANADSMITTLSVLDAQLEMTMEPVREVPVVLAQPFFRYFLARYGPRLVGIVNQTSAQEPSPRRVQRLVDLVRNSGARAILTQRQRSPRAAEAVAEATGLPLVKLDPLGGTEGRTTYEELLMHNARLLLKALEEDEP